MILRIMDMISTLIAKTIAGSNLFKNEKKFRFDSLNNEFGRKTTYTTAKGYALCFFRLQKRKGSLH